MTGYKRVFFPFLLMLLFGALAGCSQDVSDPDPTGTGGKADGVDVPQEIVFSRDDRFLGGALNEITLTHTGDGLYEATLRTVWEVSLEREETETVETLAEGLSCTLQENVICLVEAGNAVITELDFIRADDGTYAATLYTGRAARDLGDGYTRSLEPEPELEDLVFSRDDRPADGELNELRFHRNDDGTYRVSFLIAWVEWGTGENEEMLNILGENMACVFNTSVLCQKDERPADGALVEVEVQPDTDGTYTATLHQTYYDWSGTEHTDSDELADRLIRQGQTPVPAPIPATYTFLKDESLADGPLTILTVAPNDEGSYDAILVRELESITGDVTHDERVLARGLSCAFEADLLCVTTPSLVELRVEWTSNGLYDATLLRHVFDSDGGMPVTETEVIETGLELQPGAE